MSRSLCLFSVLCFGVVLGYPSRHVTRPRAVMFGSYYSNPLFGRSYDFIPQGAMTALVTDDTVATNAFSGGVPEQIPVAGGELPPLEENETVEQYPEEAAAPQDAPQPEVFSQEDVPNAPGWCKTKGEAPEVVAVEDEPVAPEAPLAPEVPAAPAAPAAPAVVADEVVAVAIPEEPVTQAARVPKRVPKQQRKRPVQKEEEDDDDDDRSAFSFPFAGAKGVPSFNTFFPITISGGAAQRSRARVGAEEEYGPGAATAIANSFSTGKGGIATSHATSFGDPYLASMLRNGLLNFKSNVPKPEA